MKKRFFFGLSFLLAGIIIGILFSVKLDILPDTESQGQKQEPSSAVIAPTLEGFSMEDAVINVASTTGKAVVSISTEHTAKTKGGQKKYYFNYPFGGEGQFGGEDNFRKFFDEFFGSLPDREYKQVGLGSGVIIDRAGYILTNEHVIEDADKITVTLSDGREFKGEVKGRDLRSDLAVIKINASNLPIAVLGNSDSLKIGQWVVAIGNPFGFAMQNPEPTVTAGVISALHRTLGRMISADRDYNDLIQTDAAINPGNSGGPLVNLRGEVIGINVAIFSTSGGYQGIGFAIPVNSAKRIISRLIEGKKILYGWLGVTVQDLTEDLTKYFGFPDKEGILVVKVLEGSPAQKAGIKESDVIKKFDNNPVRNVRELLSAVAKTEAGRSVKVLLIREKKELVLDVQIGERPQNLESAGVTQVFKNWRGLTVEDINPQNANRYNIEEKQGVVIVDVEPSSPADAAGLVPGDLIVELNKRPVNNASDYDKLVQGLKGDILIKTTRGFFIVKESE